jgi:hypothetical protein
MNLITRNGLNADPTTIPIQALDPDEKPDGFYEGVHYVEGTMDMLRACGHLTEREEDLIGEQLEEFGSATLEDEFGEESSMGDLDSKLGDSEGMEVVEKGDDDE